MATEYLIKLLESALQNLDAAASVSHELTRDRVLDAGIADTTQARADLAEILCRLPVPGNEHDPGNVRP